MKITKGNILNYLVDIKGYSEEEAHKEFSVYGLDSLTSEELEDCIEFNK